MKSLLGLGSREATATATAVLVDDQTSMFVRAIPTACILAGVVWKASIRSGLDSHNWHVASTLVHFCVCAIALPQQQITVWGNNPSLSSVDSKRGDPTDLHTAEERGKSVSTSS